MWVPLFFFRTCSQLILVCLNNNSYLVFFFKLGKDDKGHLICKNMRNLDVTKFIIFIYSYCQYMFFAGCRMY